MNLLWGVFFCIAIVDGKFYKNNITDEELRSCTTYYSRSGSVYKDFFQVKNAPSENDTLILDFHFSVLAASDAHILLAPSEDVEKSNPVYEIVIGAGGNTFCDIRRQQKAVVKQSIRRTDLLSAVDIKTFWLHVSKDGVIDVGTEGEELPFISWTDPDPLPIKVFSFSTWSGIAAKWYFDCERDEDRAKHFEKVRRKLTHLEQLRQDLLNQYNPNVRPVLNISTLTNVNMSMDTFDVSLETKTAIILLRGEAKFEWMDEKLKWNPEDYGNLKNLHLFRREIWQPDLLLYNAYGNVRDIFEDTMIIVQSNGMVHWNTTMNLKAWCDSSHMHHWPKDTHNCSFVIGFINEFDKMTLNFNENSSTIGYTSGAEWSIASVSIFTSIGWQEDDPTDPPVLQITMIVKRISNLYNTLFFTPYLVVAVSMLTTFWVSPFGKLKISLGCLQLFLSTLMLISLDMKVPSYSKNIPYLILVYSYALLGSVVSILLSIIVINLSRNKQKSPLPRFLVRLFTSGPMKFGLCLCIPKDNTVSDEYDKLSERSFKKSEGSTQDTWILLGVVIDRFSFIVYFGLIIYSLCAYY